jgi:hypothetical protein
VPPEAELCVRKQGLKTVNFSPSDNFLAVALFGWYYKPSDFKEIYMVSVVSALAVCRNTSQLVDTLTDHSIGVRTGRWCPSSREFSVLSQAAICALDIFNSTIGLYPYKVAELACRLFHVGVIAHAAKTHRVPTSFRDREILKETINIARLAVEISLVSASPQVYIALIAFDVGLRTFSRFHDRLVWI